MSRWLVLGTTLLALACGTLHVEPEPQSLVGAAPPVETHHLGLDGDFVTITVWVPTTHAPPRPAVISLLGERSTMLRLGLAVVQFKVHWEKLRALVPKKPPAPTGKDAPKMWGRWMLASPSPGTVGRGFFQIIDSTASNVVPRVIDQLADIPEIDLTRIGITGTSTNGFIALQAAADPRITAAGVIAACGDYHTFLADSTLAMAGEPLALEPTYEAWLNEREPIRHPERLTHAAVLLVNGADDPATPLSCVQRTRDVFRAAYAAADAHERFHSIVLPETGHVFPAEATHQVMAWWFRWLLREPTRDAP